MQSKGLKIKTIDHSFSVCKVEDYSQLDFEGEYFFLGRTDEEHSLVCLTENVPDHVIMRDDGWRAFRIQGVLDFSLIGILAEISSLLAKKEIGIFVISTYNTDYILTKEENYQRALEAISGAGYEVLKAGPY